MPDLRVFRTLVIGVGSTGTEVCEAVAKRIEGELGSLDRAPWVEFLCVETNAAQKSRFNGTDDFRTLSIPAPQYSDLINNPQNYNDSIALERWADIETLRQLKAGAVDTGAGNIRMVGRLALLFPQNYQDIKIAINNRLSRLRDLTPAVAKTALNEGAVSGDYAVSFADQGGGLRAIVVGTLLGGTCSGSASDFGILLQTMTSKNERIMGIFTLPHPQFGLAEDGLAQLRKTNAYHALQELNQYHNYTDQARYKTIKYYDRAFGEEVLSTDETPFDLVYLVRPRQNTDESKEQLTVAVADRVFLNVFVPDADPMATIVDGGITPPRLGRSFAFATFGLSTIEYPVRRIIDACKLKTLAHAVRQWKDRRLADGTREGEGANDRVVAETLDDLGLTVPNLVELLLRDDGGQSVRPRLQSKLAEVSRHARRGDVRAAEAALAEFRSAFGRERGEDLKGLAVRAVEANRSRAAADAVAAIAGHVRARLLDYDHGPGPLGQVLDGLAARVGELRGWEPAPLKDGAVNNALSAIDAIRRNTLLGVFGLRRKAIGRQMRGLETALNDELHARANAVAKAALRDSGSGTKVEFGTLSQIEVEAAKVRRRLHNLTTRLTVQANDWAGDAGRLEGRQSDVNGLSLFEPAPNGTVQAEFRRAVPDDQLEPLSARIIRGWTDLVRAVIPTGSDPDWLLAPHVPGQQTFDAAQLRALEQQAVEPFLGIADTHGKDAVSRLFDLVSPTFDPAAEAVGAASAAAVFLPVSDALGAPDPMTPLKKRKILLGHDLPQKFLDALTPWRATAPSAATDELADPFRVVMLEEWYKFSLRGSLDVTGPLASAKSTLYPTYYTRRREDIDWTPISDEEVAQLRTAEQLIAFGVLHDVLKLEQGHLVMDWPPQPGESADARARQRHFPARVGKAARMLAFSKTDATGRLGLANAKAILGAHVEAKYQNFAKQLGDERQANVAYVRYLQRQLLEGTCHALPDWNHHAATRRVVERCYTKPGLMQALFTVFPPDPMQLQGLFRDAGDPRPRGNGFFAESGYHCKVCGGLVGRTEQEALDAGLLCEYFPEEPGHPFGEPYDPFSQSPAVAPRSVGAGPAASGN